MNHRLKTVAPAIALALIVFFVATAVARGSGGGVAPVALPEVNASPSPAPPSPPLGGASALSDPASTRAYAIATTELAGLPPDPEPGGAFDLWVTWSPPVVEVVRIQKLIPGLTLKEIVPPVTPSGAEAAIFLVPVKSMSDLLWADRFGELSVTGLP